MANETTTTTLTEAINTEAINTTLYATAMDKEAVIPFVHMGRANNGSPTQRFVRLVSDAGAPGDRGDKVDTEYNYTEGTGLSNTALETTEGSAVAGEYGILRTFTDESIEDTIMDLLPAALENAGQILANAKDDDAIALFPSATDTVGTSGSDFTLSVLHDGIAALRKNGCHAVPGQLVCVLDEEQFDQFEAALLAISTSSANYEMTAARFQNFMPDPTNALQNAFGHMYRNVIVGHSGLTDTANMGADVVGAIFCRGDRPQDQPYAAIGGSRRRFLRAEFDRDISLPGTEMAVTERWGAGLINPAFIVDIVTDAP